MDTPRYAVRGFLHYRNDLGDGLQTAVFMDHCQMRCRSFCEGSFLEEHPVGIDETERGQYSSDELIAYLKQEQRLCASRPLGIFFTGGEPLTDPWFCLRVGEALKREGMRVSFRSCGNVRSTNLLTVKPVTDLFLLDFLTVIPSVHQRMTGFPLDKTLEVILLADRAELPYRIRMRVLPAVSDREPAVFASFFRSLNHVKSVMLDFSKSGMDEESIRAYRCAFLDQGVVLY